MSCHLSIALILFPRYIHVRIPHKYVPVLFHFEIQIIGKRMLRNTLIRANSLLRNAVNKQSVAAPMVARSMSKVNTETDDQFDNRYETYFARHDIDGWEVRKGMNDLCGMDLVPEPKIVVAALKACRRVNDYALAVRFIEAVKDKCGPKVGEIYPYILNEIRPTLGELGIDTPEELGYDKPELALEATN